MLSFIEVTIYYAFLLFLSVFVYLTFRTLWHWENTLWETVTPYRIYNNVFATFF